MKQHLLLNMWETYLIILCSRKGEKLWSWRIKWCSFISKAEWLFDVKGHKRELNRCLALKNVRSVQVTCKSRRLSNVGPTKRQTIWKMKRQVLHRFIVSGIDRRDGGRVVQQELVVPFLLVRASRELTEVWTLESECRFYDSLQPQTYSSVRRLDEGLHPIRVHHSNVCMFCASDVQ